MTRRELGRRCYIDAMFCHAMARYENVKGRDQPASEWMEMFRTCRDLVTDFETNQPDMPLTIIHAPIPCSTPGCSGVWWDTTISIWTRKQTGARVPSGFCKRCKEAS